MLTESQHSRIVRKSTAVFLRVVESLPRILLEECDADKSAAIIADLIKACLGTPVAQGDPGAALAEVIRCCHEQYDDEEDEEEAPASLPDDQTIKPSADEAPPAVATSERCDVAAEQASPSVDAGPEPQIVNRKSEIVNDSPFQSTGRTLSSQADW